MEQSSSANSSSESGKIDSLWEWIFPCLIMFLTAWHACISYRYDGKLWPDEPTTLIPFSFLCIACARESHRKRLAFRFVFFWLAMGFVDMILGS
jgi:hypothetical protein